MASPTHLLYLHGFRSSPLSTKAQQTAAWVAQHRPELVWHCPQLPPSPRDAMDQVLAWCAAVPPGQLAAIGSSLGGFYATLVAEQFGCRAALLNPAIEPARDLAAMIGETTSWHSGEAFHFRPEFIGELQALHPARISQPERYLAVIAKGDEVLDWREMAARYAHSPMRLLEGGDHALSNYPALMPEVLGFLGIGPTPG
jgi:uncharacterized protein